MACNTRYLILALGCGLIGSGIARKSRGAAPPADTPDVYKAVMKLYRGGFDSTPSLSNFRKYSRLVLAKSFSSAPALKILHDRKFVDPKMNLSNLKFCEHGSYGKVAKLYNSVASEPDGGNRESMLAGMIACMAGKESSDYWSKQKTLLQERYPDAHEKGSGVTGVFQLDATSDEGNQSLCIDQFKRWNITEELKMPFTRIGPRYAAAPDQKYNVACGTYFVISSWLSSQMHHKGTCADVVPRRDTQFGSLGEYKFKYCVNQMAVPKNIADIKDGYLPQSTPETKPTISEHAKTSTQNQEI